MPPLLWWAFLCGIGVSVSGSRPKHRHPILDGALKRLREREREMRSGSEEEAAETTPLPRGAGVPSSGSEARKSRTAEPTTPLPQGAAAPSSGSEAAKGKPWWKLERSWSSKVKKAQSTKPSRDAQALSRSTLKESIGALRPAPVPEEEVDEAETAEPTTPLLREGAGAPSSGSEAAKGKKGGNLKRGKSRNSVRSSKVKKRAQSTGASQRKRVESVQGAHVLKKSISTLHRAQPKKSKERTSGQTPGAATFPRPELREKNSKVSGLTWPRVARNKSKSPRGSGGPEKPEPTASGEKQGPEEPEPEDGGHREGRLEGDRHGQASQDGGSSEESKELLCPFTVFLREDFTRVHKMGKPLPLYLECYDRQTGQYVEWGPLPGQLNAMGRLRVRSGWNVPVQSEDEEPRRPRTGKEVVGACGLKTVDEKNGKETKLLSHLGFARLADANKKTQLMWHSCREARREDSGLGVEQRPKPTRKVEPVREKK